MLDKFTHPIVRIRERDLPAVGFTTDQGLGKFESLRCLDLCRHGGCELIDNCFDQDGPRNIHDAVQ